MNRKMISTLAGIAMLCGMGIANAQTTPAEAQQAILEVQQQLLEHQQQLTDVQILLGQTALELEGIDEFNPNADELLIAAGVDVQALLQGVTEGATDLVDDVLASVGAFLDGLGDGE